MKNIIVEAYKEIQSIEINSNQKLSEIMNLFYGVMRKYEIKQGTPHFNEKGEVVSHTCSTPEWVMCKSAISTKIDMFFTFEDLMNIPDDLQ